MDWLYSITFPTIAAIALTYFALGLVNVHWLMRIRILASLAVGALIVGALGYMLLRPEDPLGAISLFEGGISVTDAILMVLLGLLAGAVATLVCYPLGNVLGPLAAPAGLAVLALFNGGIKQLLLTNDSLQSRNILYGTLRLETLLWLAVCASGYVGVLLATRLVHKKAVILHPEAPSQKPQNLWFNGLIAAAVSAVVAYFMIRVLVRDIRQTDDMLKFVMGTPGNGQIAFGVFVSAGLSAFLAKRFIQSYYIPVIIGIAILYIGFFTKYIGSDILNHMVQQWPIDFFPQAIYAITPLQLVSFSVLGAIAGYWTAIRMMQPTEEK